MKKKYWYKFYIWECPVCGNGGSAKERHYTRKPKDGNKRYEYSQRYDYCLEYEALR